MTCGKMNSKKMETGSSDSSQYAGGKAQNLHDEMGRGIIFQWTTVFKPLAKFPYFCETSSLEFSLNF